MQYHSRKKNSELEIEETTKEKKEVVEEPTQKIEAKESISGKKEEQEKKISKPIQVGKPKTFSSFSIKDKLNQNQNTSQTETENNEVENKDEVREEIHNQEFTEKDLIETWHKFSNKMGDKPRIFNTLTSKDPKLEDNNIVSFIIDNNLQETKINEIRNELIGYLKAELKNNSLELKLIINEIEEENNKLYTAEDKFNHMISKNKDLGNLKKEFNLDLD